MFFIRDDRLTKGGRDLDDKEDRRNSAKPLIMTLMTMTMKMMNTKVKVKMKMEMMMMMIDDDDG